MLRHYESGSENAHFDLSPGNSCIAGLGVGLFVATAVSLSSSLSDLIVSGSEAVRIAFRLGAHVDKISQNLEARNPDAALESWAYVITELSEEIVQKELDRLNKSMVGF